MFRMSHLGPHTFVAEDNHHSGRHWIHHFAREERHRMIEEDRAARSGVLAILVSALSFGLVLWMTMWIVAY